MASLDKARTIPCKNAIKLAAYCGLRAGEIQKLKPEHIKKGHIWLNFDQKSGANIETVPIPKSFKLTPKMLPLGSATELCYIDLEQPWEQLEGKICDFMTYGHTYASWLVQNEVDLYLVRNTITT